VNALGRRSRLVLGVVFLTAVISAAALPEGAASVAGPKTILDLQPYKRITRVAVRDPAGHPGTATLVEINPHINAWSVLTLAWGDAAPSRSYHLENGDPRTQLRLLASGIELSANGHSAVCALWAAEPEAPDRMMIERAARAKLPYAPLCNDRLYLRNHVRGTRTQIERVTDLLRDHVWGGDKIVGFVRDTFFRDAFVEKAAPAAASLSAAARDNVPRAARLEVGSRPLQAAHLGIRLGVDVGPDQAGAALDPGRWYAVPGAAGIFLSALQPHMIEHTILDGDRGAVTRLDAVEANALDYLVAFDLAQFDLGFALGTDHPRVDWSDRVPDNQRPPGSPGPDGIGNTLPLATSGMLNPALVLRAAATFTGGFKREHGAFHFGPLSERNGGSHYGFIEHGAVFSTLQPGLATLYVLDDGTVNMKTWTASDNALLPRIRDARQNGVALIDYDAVNGISAPGALVDNWGAGNWSGSANEKLRTLRAGVCLQENSGRRYLIYGYFSTATPSAMVRVFQSYGCRYALHLDMNALEHTYLALYLNNGGELRVQHLIQDMAVVDKKGGEPLAPRFLGFPDDRDFFYLLRRLERP